MVRRCVAQHCGNTTKSGKSLHKFPEDPRLRKIWERFVKAKRADFVKASNYSELCSDHFLPTCFSSPLRLAAGLGIYQKLEPGSVPTIHTTQDSQDAEKGKISKKKSSQFRREKAIRKLEVARMVATMDVCQEENGTIENSVQNQVLGINENSGTECPNCCKAKSALLKVDVGTQTQMEKDTSFSEDESETDTENDISDDEIKDPSFSPTKWHEMYDHPDIFQEEFQSNSEIEELPQNPRESEKYIVYWSELVKLLQNCPQCHETCTLKQNELGSFLSVKIFCSSCQYSGEWSSQPKFGQQPLGNVEIAAAILFSGCPISRSLRMFKFLKIATISETTFYHHQTNVLQPIICSSWEEEQASIFSRLREMDTGLILCGDGRSDSPGHSAKYGGYNIIEARINKILDIQVVQSNEVPNSSWCEHEGLKRTVDFLKGQDFYISTLITDRHPQNTAWIRKELQGTVHYFDVWHIAKGLTKRLDTLAKQKECKDVAQWRKSLINHLYFAAGEAKGDGDLCLAMWKSIVNHIQNIHRGHGELYPQCAHGHLSGEARKKLWLKADTTAGAKVADLLESKYLLKDVQKMSPIHQTSGLEAFHSLILNFAPKHTAYSYQGMTCRLLLAAMHYNENSDRLQAVTVDGRPQYSLRFPKSKKGGHSVSIKKTKPTFEYANTLIGKVVDAVKGGLKAALKAVAADRKTKEPDSLASKIINRPTKESAVEEYNACRRRFQNT